MRSFWLLLAGCLLASCRTSKTTPHSQQAPPVASNKPHLADTAELAQAELKRDSSAIDESALSSRDPVVRRVAARALARIADARAVELLMQALADEDDEVVTWAAYGLGYACSGHEQKTVRALVARAASLADSTNTPAPLASPAQAIAEALGRCANSEAEATLRAWLDGPQTRAEAAALALGRLAARNGRLQDSTLVALLDAAARPQTPLPGALYACTRLPPLNESTEHRLRTVALQLITAQRPGREFAVRALARSGEEGLSALGALLADPKQDADLRAEAAHALAALGVSAQATLWTAFDSLAAENPGDDALLAPSYGAFSALLAALTPPARHAVTAKLTSLATLPIGAGDGASLKRRKIQLRCSAAALLADRNYQSPLLTACAPDGPSRARDLAVLAAIFRDKLRNARRHAYLSLLGSTDVVVREAALAGIAQHPEAADAYHWLAEALGATSLGVVATAAQVLASYPDRAARARDPQSDAASAPSPDPSVVKALTQAYATMRPHHNVDVQARLLDATGALQILSLKSLVVAACGSDNPTLREHAETALHLLGEQSRRCDQVTRGAPPPQAAPVAPAAPAAPSSKVALAFDTEAGPLTLTLDPRFAPNAVARILALVRAGFYDGLPVQRVVPGFVAQFGDPGGDGFGGDDQPPLRCETSPIPFVSGSVGIALAGRDTGASQLFVTLGRYPSLDGESTWIGQAGPGWDRVAPGDRIRHVQVISE